MKDKVDLTYGCKLKALVNVIQEKELDVDYTIDCKSGKPATVSILINPKTMEMITFNYQELKKLVGDSDE